MGDQVNYLNLILTIRANMAAADACGDEGDLDGADVLQNLAFEVWDRIAADLRKGVVINTDGWSLESSQLLETIIERTKEEDREDG